ncbi:MAG TPA: TPM domain-containing protein [Thermoanaerobaculia bacterium]|jgi:hypothetical protein|nr:TPM domain-containing protein [Thermoanaerobaculia bacterium]
MKRSVLPWLALYLAIAGAYFLALNGYGTETATRGALVMAIFVLLSIGAIRSIFRSREDERLFHAAMTGKPPVDGQRSAVVGTLHTLGPALTSPFSNTLCAFYFYRIFRTETVEVDTDEGPSTQTLSRADFGGNACTPLVVRTRTGEVRVGRRFVGQGYLPIRLTEPAHYANAGDYLRITRFADRSGSKKVNFLSDLENSLSHPVDEERVDYRHSEGPFVLDPRIHKPEETIIPIGERVCVIGLYQAARRELVAQPRKFLKIVRGTQIRTLIQTRNEAWQKVGAAIFLLIASHIGLMIWLSRQDTGNRPSGATVARSQSPEPAAAQSDSPQTTGPEAAVSAQEIPSPRPAGWIVDLTGRLPKATLDQINRLGDVVKVRRSAELAVAVVSRIDGVSQENFASDLFKSWDLDERGMLLVVSVDDQRAELHLGRGLASLTASRTSSSILKGVVMYNLRNGDPAAAVLAGANAAASRILDLPVTAPSAEQAP